MLLLELRVPQVRVILAGWLLVRSKALEGHLAADLEQLLNGETILGTVAAKMVELAEQMAQAYGYLDSFFPELEMYPKTVSFKLNFY